MTSQSKTDNKTISATSNLKESGQTTYTQDRRDIGVRYQKSGDRYFVEAEDGSRSGRMTVDELRLSEEGTNRAAYLDMIRTDPRGADEMKADKIEYTTVNSKNEEEKNIVYIKERTEDDGTVKYEVEHINNFTGCGTEEEIIAGKCGQKLSVIFPGYIEAKKNGTLSEFPGTALCDNASRFQIKITGTHASKSVDSGSAASLRSGFNSWLNDRDTVSGYSEQRSSLAPSTARPISVA